MSHIYYSCARQYKYKALLNTSHRFYHLTIISIYTGLWEGLHDLTSIVYIRAVINESLSSNLTLIYKAH